MGLGSVAALECRGHLAKQPRQGGLHHHLGEWIQFRVAADQTSAPSILWSERNVDGEFHWCGGLGDQFKHPSFRGLQGRRSHQMHGHTARDLERTAVPFSLKVGHRPCAEQFAERGPIQEIFRHPLARGVQRNGRRFNPCHGVCCCSLQATGSADQPSRRVCCPSVMYPSSLACSSMVG